VLVRLSDIKANILIVDDNAETRSAIRMTLGLESQVSYKFKEAGTAESGLQSVKSNEPNIIILDLHLPGKSGFDFLSRLNKMKPRLKERVLILTADDSLKNIWQAESHGVNAYHFMGKPFESDELRAQVLGLALTN
jgi:DNA-binding response OmpR family regulator